MRMLIPTGRKVLLCLSTALLCITATAQERKLLVRQQASEMLAKNLPATGLNQSALTEYIVSDAYTDKKQATCSYTCSKPIRVFRYSIRSACTSSGAIH